MRGVHEDGPDLGLSIVRDAHGPRAVDTLLRYRGSAHAELFRALAALKVLQAETGATAGGASASLAAAQRNEPETRS